jgi:SSS family transporter
MTALDWLVLAATIGFIVAYGVWKTRGAQSVEGFLRGGGEMKWYAIGLSIMATQASAITFLSLPGQAYQDGMRFVQFYFGLPIAMVVLSATVVPIYYRQKVFTAYEYLEQRFDRKTRQLAAFLFLLQRGLSAGITIYAPAIILSQVLGWPLKLTNAVIGLVVILYTVSGGTRAVSQTQRYQMVVMMAGMALAGVYIVHQLPPGVSFRQAVAIAGGLGRMNVVDFTPNFGTRYTFWSGMTGGLFVAMAYFGTDQSQVGRYLGGRSIAESRMGLLFNGLFKVPMQFALLLVGLLVLVYHQFSCPPMFFNQAELTRAQTSGAGPELAVLDRVHNGLFERKKAATLAFVAASEHGDATAATRARAELRDADARDSELRDRVRAIIKRVSPRAETKDADYIFLSFVLAHFPPGLVGLLLAVILCAAMSASASELQALGSTTMIDFYKRSWRPGQDDAHYLAAAKLLTAGWGLVAVGFATFAALLDNLIQAVNILGSIFYGPILGIFLCAFFWRRARATPVFVAAVLAQLAVVAAYFATSIGFLWYNVIGCVIVVAAAAAIQSATPRRYPAP